MAYAIVEAGGKQYRVQPGDAIEVERLSAEPGSTIELHPVLLLSDGHQATLGRPNLPDARVVAEVLEHTRGPKVIVFKYKPKVRYRVKQGHRQAMTRLVIRYVGAEGLDQAQGSGLEEAPNGT